MSSDDEDATRATDPRYIWDRTSAVYRRRPQYVAGRAMASQRAMPLDPGPGTQTSFATLRGAVMYWVHGTVHYLVFRSVLGRLQKCNVH